MPSIVTFLTDYDQHDLVAVLLLSIRDANDEAGAWRAERLARLLGVADLYKAHVRPKKTTPRDAIKPKK